MLSKPRMPRLLILFSLVNLVVGSGAFAITGILSLMALDFGVSVAAVGLAVSFYAVSTALLAPLLLVATGAWPRKRAILLAMSLFTAGGALCAVAPSLAWLLAGRVLMGAGAAFTPLTAGIAVALVEPARRGQALALVFLGVSLSYVVGLPLGAWIGFTHGWHATIWAATAASALAFAALWWWVPAGVRAPGVSFDGLGALLKRADLLAVLGLTLLYFTAIFTVFSYIGPVLKALVPMGSNTLSLTLMLFGLSGVVGTLLGGAANDRFGARPTLLLLLATLVASMAVLPLAAGHYAAMLAVMLVWGTAGFGMMAPQQSRLAMMAPAQAPLLLSLNTSMLYLGTALGAVVGGLAATPLGFDRLAWAGVPFAALGWLLLVFGSPVAGAVPQGVGQRR
jgi:MFS transporter, DHA1 family, inner membrane transport protein